MASQDINLLKTKTSLSPQVVAVQGQLKMGSYVAIAIVIVIGVLVGVSYSLLNFQLGRIENQKKTLIAQLNTLSRKEGLYVSLKQRLPIVEKALGGQRLWGSVLQTLNSVAVPPELTSVAIDDKNVMVLTLQTNSIETTASMVNAVITLARDRKIRSPQLVALQLLEDGAVQLSISFLPAI